MRAETTKQRLQPRLRTRPRPRTREEQRTAKRVRERAELAKARADAESTRRKADAELAARGSAAVAGSGGKSATAVKVAAKPAPSFGCMGLQLRRIRRDPSGNLYLATFTGGRLGAARQARSQLDAVRGAPSADGGLQLSGRGFSSRKQLGQPRGCFSGKLQPNT
jgi:hypothetical protein